MGLSKAATSTTSAKVVIDADYLKTYNEDHQTDFELYPQELVSFADGGILKFVSGAKTAEVGMTISGGTEVLEGKTYAIPVAISEPSEDISATDSQSTHCMYLVKICEMPRMHIKVKMR